MSGSAKKLLHAAAGTAAAGGATYVEDVFNTTVFTGDGQDNRAFNIGLDLENEGGMVWTKTRVSGDHALFDTERGALQLFYTSVANASSNTVSSLVSFDDDGFTLSSNTPVQVNNKSSVAWSFRKAPGFFDVVKYTGTGSARTVAHNLGSVPGMIVCKSVDASASWITYHNGANNGSNPQKYWMKWDNTNAAAVDNDIWNNTQPTATEFTVKTGPNANGTEYVAYIFASGTDSASQIFGDDEDEAIIKTGVFEAAANTDVDLGFEPQWIMFKNTSDTNNWQIVDNMRGMPSLQNDQQLMANLDNAESANGLTTITPTGFTWLPSAASNYYIYTAIRRGPMKEPDAGTDVFAVDKANTGTMPPMYHSGFPVDLQIEYNSGEDAAYRTKDTYSRLGGHYLEMNTTDAALTGASSYVSRFAYMNGATDGSSTIATKFSYMWRRYPKVFDVVVYDGNATAPMDVKHNLGVPAELLIFKKTSATEDWNVLNSVGSGSYNNTGRMFLNTNAAYSNTGWGGTLSSATAITVNTSYFLNQTGSTYIAYLFATLAGVSKVGSVVHSGTTNVDCGFSGGARFVLIKRTDSTGDWYVFDSLRGIQAGNEDCFLLNTDGALITGYDYIAPLASGFTLTSSFTAGTYLYLAFA